MAESDRSKHGQDDRSSMEKKMTTLPQTTGTRFPRAGNRAPAIPGGIQTVAVGHAAANQLTPADIWRIFRANAWLIALLTSLGAILGYVANMYLAANHGKYTATGTLLISPSRVVTPDNPSGSTSFADSQTMAIEQATNANMLLAEGLWRQVLSNSNSGITNTDWYKQLQLTGSQLDTPKALDNLDSNFRVRPVPGTKLVQLSMSASKASDAATIVQDIGDRHIINQRDLQRSSREEELVAVKNFEENVKNRIESARASIAATQTNLGGVGGSGGRLAGLQMQLSTLSTRRVDMQGDLDTEARQLAILTKQFEDGLVPAAVTMQVQATPEVADLQQRLTLTELDKDSIIRTGKGSTTVAEIDARIAAIRAKLTSSEERYRSQYTSAMIEGSKQTVSIIQDNVRSLDAQINEVNNTIGQLSREQADMLAKQEGIRMNEETLRQIENKIVVLQAAAEADRKSLATVQWAQTAVEPTSMSFPRLPVTMALATMLGLGLAVGIAFLRELLDTSIRSPRDLAKVGNLNMLGMIPHESDDPQAEGAVLPLVISQSPHSIMAENFRQVRTRLQHAASLDTTRSLLVTSPSAGDGKTTVACNIAAGLALNGRKILLVDANFRRPNLHSVFGVTNDAGFGNVLAGQATTESVAKKTQVPGLDVLPTGPRPANPTELLESQLLVEFIDRSLEEYDHVIFDSGPVLLVSETVALAPRVDGVVTVVKAQQSSRGVLQRMRDALRQIKAEHLGVVLNGVRTQGGGYYGRNIKNYYAYQNSN
jgi:polysaccharide biosynthesis transport protein